MTVLTWGNSVRDGAILISGAFCTHVHSLPTNFSCYTSYGFQRIAGYSWHGYTMKESSLRYDKLFRWDSLIFSFLLIMMATSNGGQWQNSMLCQISQSNKDISSKVEKKK